MIQQYENALRDIISLILGDADNTDFKVPPERLEKWKSVRDKEKKQNKGILVENRILYYSDLFDLGTIISQNWDKFEVVFKEKDRFLAHFNEIKILRNTIMHGRDLLPYQEHFILFAVGDLKTKIINYHNRNMNIDDYFIRILRVSDNMNHIWINPNPREGGFDTGSILRVGDRLEFVVDAYDPKGREIEYKLSCGKLRLKNNNGKFVVDISDDMISPLIHLDIEVSTKEMQYENVTRFTAFYTVLP